MDAVTPVMTQSHRQFVRAVGEGVIASVDAQAHPQAALVGLAVAENGDLIFDSLLDARKIENIRRHPRVAVVISRGLVSLQIEGTARIAEGEERASAAEVYLTQFPQSRVLHQDFAVVRVVPDWVRRYDAAVD